MYNRMIRATGQPSFQRLGHAKLITGRGDVRRAFTPDQALAEMADPEQVPPHCLSLARPFPFCVPPSALGPRVGLLTVAGVAAQKRFGSFGV